MTFFRRFIRWWNVRAERKRAQYLRALDREFNPRSTAMRGFK